MRDSIISPQGTLGHSNDYSQPVRPSELRMSSIQAVDLRMSKLNSDPQIGSNDEDFIAMCEQNMDIITNKYLYKSRAPSEYGMSYRDSQTLGHGSYMRPIEYQLQVEKLKVNDIDTSFTPFNP